jgi:hypothetical protein
MRGKKNKQTQMDCSYALRFVALGLDGFIMTIMIYIPFCRRKSTFFREDQQRKQNFRARHHHPSVRFGSCWRGLGHWPPMIFGVFFKWGIPKPWTVVVSILSHALMIGCYWMIGGYLHFRTPPFDDGYIWIYLVCVFNKSNMCIFPIRKGEDH